jgi:hypothetical protein
MENCAPAAEGSREITACPIAFCPGGIIFAPDYRRAMNRLGLSLLVASLASLVGFRQSPPPASGASSSNRTTASPAARRRIRAFVGEVLTVEPKALRFSARESLKDGSLKSTTFDVDTRTKFSRANSVASFADLHPNDHVIVKYNEDHATRRKKAVSVTIVPPATTQR